MEEKIKYMLKDRLLYYNQQLEFCSKTSRFSQGVETLAKIKELKSIAKSLFGKFWENILNEVIL